MGTEAAVYAAEASDNNDLLERVLPATVSEYIELVKAHLVAGPNYRFASRQLLLLGAMLDFSDVTNWKVASSFVQELLQRPLEHEVDENGNKFVIGDGINLGGDRDWAEAVSGLARKVYTASGEFEEVVIRVLDELARPCRERTAEVMHCLAVTGLLLENTKSLRFMQGKAFEPAELLQSLLLPGSKHVHLDVLLVATRCLGLFGLLERKPSEELIKQLRLSFVKGPSPISIMACKALFDLAMWHGPQEVDKAMGQDLSSQLRDHVMVSCTVQMSDTNGDLNFELLDLLFAGFDRGDWGKSADADDNESVQAVIGEGFAKILLLSENYPSIPSSTHPLLLAKLIGLYFSDETKELQRLRQCLSVFFEHYPSLSSTHKRCVSKAFIPVMRLIWPGINGNPGGSPLMVSNKRKHAVLASRFMLQMIQASLYAKETKTMDENDSKDLPETLDGSIDPSHDFENGEEGLAICIAAEVANFHMKKKAAEKSYVLALCRILVLLHFRLPEQGAIKLMRRLLNRVVESVSAEKELVKELKRMADRLKAADRHPDQDLSLDEVNTILGRLELDLSLDLDNSMEMAPTPASASAPAPTPTPTPTPAPAPAPHSTRPTRSRRRVRHKESSSDDENTPTASVAPPNPGIMITRSQRASKTAALTKMTANNRAMKINDDLDEEGSEVTSEEDSGESGQSNE